VRTKVTIVSVALLLAAVVTHLPTDALAEGMAPALKPCPYLVRFDQVKMSIAEIRYTTEIQGMDGNRMKMPQDKQDKFRYAVVAIRVRKPAGMRLSLAAADLTIHYYHGTAIEAAPCEGISTFSTTLDVDRPMKLPRMQGPGWTKMTTGARATQASEVYFDAVFAMVEPDTREVWLCVGQPTTTQPYISKGWK